MGWFAVRVELHQLDNQRQPTWDDYSRLHVAMQQRGTKNEASVGSDRREFRPVSPRGFQSPALAQTRESCRDGGMFSEGSCLKFNGSDRLFWCPE